MGERTQYAAGTFSYVELGTTDLDAARQFYGPLLGWDFEDTAMPDGRPYTMAHRTGRIAAALYEEPTAGAPPAWMSYVTVDSADDMVRSAEEIGAIVISPPFDVTSAGRMAVLHDPTGAVFALWQARDRIGAEVVNTPGSLTLNQCNTSDPERAERFYRDLFGWNFTRQTEAGVEPSYWGIWRDGVLNGGMMALPEGASMPSHWLAYFGIDDVDAATATITERGVTVLVPPMDVQGGRIAVAADPQGAVFGLFAGRFDD